MDAFDTVQFDVAGRGVNRSEFGIERCNLGGSLMPAQRKYPEELIERAVRMIVEKRRQTPGRPGIIREVGDLLGILPEALRHWVKKMDAAAQAVASVWIAGS